MAQGVKGIEAESPAAPTPASPAARVPCGASGTSRRHGEAGEDGPVVAARQVFDPVSRDRDPAVGEQVIDRHRRGKTRPCGQVGSRPMPATSAASR